MRGNYNRRTATKVKGGKVQRKNRRTFTCLERLVVDRESPGNGFRHIVTKADVLTFIELIPDWERLSDRLERISLVGAGKFYDGLYQFYSREESGVISLCAWPEDLWFDVSCEYFADHKVIFDRLGLAYENTRTAKDNSSETTIATCRFTETQAKAFILLHIFMHELGHHYDQIHQKHWGSSRGETYAEKFAMDRFDFLFPLYVAAFGDPRRGT